jgi:hypothetical protein
MAGARSLDGGRWLRARCALTSSPGLSLAGQPVRRMRRTPRDGASKSDRLLAVPTASRPFGKLPHCFRFSMKLALRQHLRKDR